MDFEGTKTYFFDRTARLPLVLEWNPRRNGTESQQVEQASRSGMDSALDWLRRHHAGLSESLSKSGGILFRGFPVDSPADFERFVRALDSRIMKYEAGTSDREKVLGDVHTSTTMPAYFKMALHHEMAYRRETPEKIFFYCERAPWMGGQTTIGDSRRIYSALAESIRDRFAREPVRLERRLANAVGLWRWLPKLSRSFRMMTWQKVFATGERSEVETILNRQGYKFQWSARGDLSFWNDLEAVATHPVTGERVWFRPLHFFDFSARVYGRVFYWLARIGFSLAGRPLPLLKWATGEPVERNSMSAVLSSIEQHEVNFKWRAGDVLCLDNRLIAHGRNRYLGPRRVLVLMTGPKEPVQST